MRKSGSWGPYSQVLPADNAVREALHEMLFRRARSTVLSGLFISVLYFSYLLGKVDDGLLYAWLLLNLVGNAMILPMAMVSSHWPSSQLPVRRYTFATALVGSSWGLTAFFLTPELGSLQQIIIFVLVNIQVVIAILSSGVWLPTFHAYAVTSLLPFIAVVSLRYDLQYTSLWMPLTGCLFAMLWIGGRIFATAVYGVKKRLEVRSLLESLQQNNEEIAAARDEACEALRIKSEFLARISHELRTPMNGVLGMAESLGNSSLDDAQRRSLKVLRASGVTMLSHIENLLEITELESGDVQLDEEDFSLAELINENLDLHQSAAEARRLTLASEIDNRLPPYLLGDQRRLGKLLRALLSNAVKFSSDGEVKVLVEGYQLASETPMLQLDVVDQGVGIPADQLARIFDVFHQVDGGSERHFEGNGLGLSIARNLAVQMGGNIDVFSEAGEGSTFRVNLPLVQGRQPVQGPAAGGAPLVAERQDKPAGGAVLHDVDAGDIVETEGELLPLAGVSGQVAEEAAFRLADRDEHVPRVLVAEDNPVNQAVLESILDGLAVNTTLVENGADAVAVAAKGKFDLVLMDCQMPRMNGLDATRELRRRGFDSPIVAVTANAMAGDRQACLDAGMNDHVAKPFTADTIRGIVDIWTGGIGGLPHAA